LRTIQRFEAAEGIRANRSGTLDRIKTLEVAGIVFLGDPISSPGVQLSDGTTFMRLADRAFTGPARTPQLGPS
jgi:hypothetical protein